MTMAGKKRLAWVLMSGGAGATLLFGVVLWLNGRGLSPSEWPAYAWPIIGAVSGVFGWRWLRALYRQEPPVPPAAWTVSIADLVCGTILAGLCATFVSSDSRFSMLTPLAAVGGFALYMGSALAASLMGVMNGIWRPLYVLAHASSTLGMMGVVSLILIVCIIPAAASTATLRTFLSDLFFPGSPNRDWITVLRLMLGALIPGLISLALLHGVIGVGKGASKP